MADQIIVFNSTHQAIKTEDIFRDNDIDFEVVPLPKGFTADCGLALLVSGEDIKNVEFLIENSRIEIKGMFESESY